MILENGIVDNPEDVGFYSGLIESVFAFMSFLAGTCYPNMYVAINLRLVSFSYAVLLPF